MRTPPGAAGESDVRWSYRALADAFTARADGLGDGRNVLLGGSRRTVDPLADNATCT